MCTECEKKDKIIAAQSAEIDRLRALRTVERERIANFVRTRFGDCPAKPGDFIHIGGNREPYELAPGFAPDEELNAG